MSKKKICILGTANIKHMTLISLYTEVFKEANQKFDIIYIDKYQEYEEYDADTLYRFELKIESNWSFSRKLAHYWSYKKFAIDIIKREKYDFIIVWNEFTAFMFSDFLSRNYSNRYCVNIRDQNFNRNPLVQLKYKQAIKRSCFSTISSEKFRGIFPNHDYLFIHSFNKNLVNGIIPVANKRPLDKPLRIMFIGRMSYPESIYKTIDSLGNDPRFEVSFIGAGCGVFTSYISERGYENIFIHDSFDPKDTPLFLSSVDIIYSLNKENDIHSDTLLPIKLYYAIAKHIPILVYKSSYTYEFAKKHNIDIGISGKDFERLGDIIFNEYQKLTQEKIDDGCKKAINDIFETHKKLNEKIEKFIL
ncbi:hypothetical protein QU593_02240 [Rossellomorea marisflavi]|uniref:hypothetical protein n=1 Tax=Rossellomorea marisflavi TaxID=189381 RepID=UPI0025B057E5|nr:hypothetical protein [Rossellomorea marisflavi]WJV19351.1 hypothetical protein QU593_02240 [Rossellomorea marisflavi]